MKNHCIVILLFVLTCSCGGGVEDDLLLNQQDPLASLIRSQFWSEVNEEFYSPLEDELELLGAEYMIDSTYLWDKTITPLFLSNCSNYLSKPFYVNKGDVAKIFVFKTRISDASLSIVQMKRDMNGDWKIIGGSLEKY